MSSTASAIEINERTATRFSILADVSFEKLTAAFEALVPKYPGAELQALLRSDAPWEKVVQFAQAYSPLGLLIYWQDDVTPLMTKAGNDSKCALYFIGNFPVAERMFGSDPRVMNYLPLRMTITETKDGAVRFTTDQPGQELASFGNEHITTVGHGVDGKVGQLLQGLGLPVPSALIPPAAPNAASQGK